MVPVSGVVRCWNAGNSWESGFMDWCGVSETEDKPKIGAMQFRVGTQGVLGPVNTTEQFVVYWGL